MYVCTYTHCICSMYTYKQTIEHLLFFYEQYSVVCLIKCHKLYYTERLLKYVYMYECMCVCMYVSEFLISFEHGPNWLNNG